MIFTLSVAVTPAQADPIPEPGEITVISGPERPDDFIDSDLDEWDWDDLPKAERKAREKAMEKGTNYVGYSTAKTPPHSPVKNPTGLTSKSKKKTLKSVEGAWAYTSPTTCNPEFVGVIALRQLVVNQLGGQNWQYQVACKSDGTPVRNSEHAEGRAWDWGVYNPSTKKWLDGASKKKVDDLISWLIADGPDGQPGYWMRRLGIMYVVWNNKIWGVYKPYWRHHRDQDECEDSKGKPKNNTHCHRDHVHFSFSWPGAFKQTSFWTGVKYTGSIQKPKNLSNPTTSTTTCPAPASKETMAATWQGTLVYYAQVQAQAGTTPSTEAIRTQFKTLQASLNAELGSSLSPKLGVDGVFGPKSKEAYSKWQCIRKKPANGIPDITTLETLAARQKFKVRAGKVSGVTVTAGASSATVSWKKRSEARAYQIIATPTNSKTAEKINVTTSKTAAGKAPTSHTLTGLVPGVTYEVKVRVRNHSRVLGAFSSPQPSVTAMHGTKITTEVTATTTTSGDKLLGSVKLAGTLKTNAKLPTTRVITTYTSKTGKTTTKKLKLSPTDTAGQYSFGTTFKKTASGTLSLSFAGDTAVYANAASQSKKVNVPTRLTRWGGKGTYKVKAGTKKNKSLRIGPAFGRTFYLESKIPGQPWQRKKTYKAGKTATTHNRTITLKARSKKGLRIRYRLVIPSGMGTKLVSPTKLVISK